MCRWTCQSRPYPVLPRPLRQLPLRAGLRQRPLRLGRQRLLHAAGAGVGQRNRGAPRQDPTPARLLYQQLAALGAQHPPADATQAARHRPPGHDQEAAGLHPSAAGEHSGRRFCSWLRRVGDILLIKYWPISRRIINAVLFDLSAGR